MMSSCDPVTKILGKRKWVVVMCTTSRSSPLLKGKNVSYLFIIFARWDKDVMVIAGRLSWTMRLINKLIIVKQPYQLSRWLPPPCHSSKKFKDLKKKPTILFCMSHYYFGSLSYNICTSMQLSKPLFMELFKSLEYFCQRRKKKHTQNFTV